MNFKGNTYNLVPFVSEEVENSCCKCDLRGGGLGCELIGLPPFKDKDYCLTGEDGKGGYWEEVKK